MPAKAGKKGRKIGRCKRSPSCQRYTNEQRWIKNKARKILKQIRKFPNWKPYNMGPSVAAIVYQELKKA